MNSFQHIVPEKSINISLNSESIEEASDWCSSRSLGWSTACCNFMNYNLWSRSMNYENNTEDTKTDEFRNVLPQIDFSKLNLENWYTQNLSISEKQYKAYFDEYPS